MRRVYKFLEAKWALECIRKKRLKISLIPELNDPWEGRAIRFERESQEVAWDFMRNALSSLTGLLCFSEDWSDPVLWSHYAGNHTGIVLGFDIVEADSSGESFFSKVRYVDDLEHFPLQQGKDEAEEKLIRALTTKFSNWKYEQEVRYFLKLKNADPQSGIFFTYFGDHLKLREIIFGVRHLNFSEKAELVAAARLSPEVVCKSVCMAKSEFKMIEDRAYYFPTEPL